MHELLNQPFGHFIIIHQCCLFTVILYVQYSNFHTLVVFYLWHRTWYLLIHSCCIFYKVAWVSPRDCSLNPWAVGHFSVLDRGFLTVQSHGIRIFQAVYYCTYKRSAIFLRTLAVFISYTVKIMFILLAKAMKCETSDGAYCGCNMKLLPF